MKQASSILLHRLSLATTAKPNYTIFFQLELGGFGSLGTGSSGMIEEVLNRNIPGSYTSNLNINEHLYNLVVLYSIYWHS